jgi:hypothetical protein
MDTTISQAIVICAAILTVLNLIDKIFIIKKQIDHPTDERLCQIEAKLIQHDQRFDDQDAMIKMHSGHLDADNKRIEVLQEGSRIQSKALLVLINHANGSGNPERMQEVEHELDEYIFSK